MMQCGLLSQTTHFHAASYLVNVCHQCMEDRQGRTPPALHWKSTSEHNADWQKHQDSALVHTACAHSLFKNENISYPRKSPAFVHMGKKTTWWCVMLTNAKHLSEQLPCPALTQREIQNVQRYLSPSSLSCSPLQKASQLTRGSEREIYSLPYRILHHICSIDYNLP